MITIFILLMILITAVYYDFRTFKVPNRLILIGSVTGLLADVLKASLYGLGQGILGFFLPLLILMPLYCIRALGAGDIKLFACIGSFIGTEVIKCIFLSMAVGAIYGICCMAVTHQRLTKGGRTKIHFTVPIIISVIIMTLVVK